METLDMGSCFCGFSTPCLTLSLSPSLPVSQYKSSLASFHLKCQPASQSAVRTNSSQEPKQKPHLHAEQHQASTHWDWWLPSDVYHSRPCHQRERTECCAYLGVENMLLSTTAPGLLSYGLDPSPWSSFAKDAFRMIKGTFVEEAVFVRLLG